jgi:hypothetical protein
VKSTSKANEVSISNDQLANFVKKDKVDSMLERLEDRLIEKIKNLETKLETKMSDIKTPEARPKKKMMMVQEETF